MVDKPAPAATADTATLTGVKYLRRIYGMLERLNVSGTERDDAGNRTLLFGHYVGLILLGLFNPTMHSLRGLVELSKLKKVQRALGSSPTSLGSISESVRVFDPELLAPLLAELVEQVHTRRGGNRTSIPEDLAQRLTAVDGSVLKILPELVAAAGSEKGKWRMHLHFDLWHGIPTRATVLPDGAGGNADERSVLRDTVQAHRTYVIDAGYERYALFQQIVDARSDYVCRVQKREVEVLEPRPLTEASKAAGVVSDELVQLGNSRAEVGKVQHQVRRLILSGVTTPERPRTDRVRSPDIVLLTNLVDVPAEVVAEIYRQRWTIELFFRFFKHVLRCKTLLSTKEEGVAIQVYCALIAALLLSLITQHNFGRRGFELLCLYLQGWADEEEVLAGLDRLRQSPPRKRR